MRSQFDKIAVIGLGYIGLPTAAILASKSIKVIGVDIDQHTVATINAGKVHIVEPDLDVLVRSVVNQGYLQAVSRIQAADAFLIAVPTPCNKDSEPDLSYIHAVVPVIAAVLQPGNLIILESTSPVGTTEQLATQFASLRPDLNFPHQDSSNPDINIAYCPERVLPGRVIYELVQNNRIIGGMSPKCSQKAVELYTIFTKGNCFVTNCRTAEMTKLTENAFRDVNLAFANELAMICDKLNVDIWELIKLSNHHPRVNILRPGPGVGGHCIAVDPWFIVHAAPEQAKLLRVAREVNDAKPKFVVDKIHAAASAVHQPVIACLGLTYKENIDDLRESPSIKIVQQLILDRIDYSILVVEPNIINLPKNLSESGRCKLATIEHAAKYADIVVLLVNHAEFLGVHGTYFLNKIFINLAVMSDDYSKNKIPTDEPLNQDLCLA